MRIGLATAPIPTSLEHAVQNVLAFIDQAANFAVNLLCFPEAYVPGLRGHGLGIPLSEQEKAEQAREGLWRSPI